MYLRVPGVIERPRERVLRFYLIRLAVFLARGNAYIIDDILFIL